MEVISLLSRSGLVRMVTAVLVTNGGMMAPRIVLLASSSRFFITVLCSTSLVRPDRTFPFRTMSKCVQCKRINDRFLTEPNSGTFIVHGISIKWVSLFLTRISAVPSSCIQVDHIPLDVFLVLVFVPC